MHPNNVNLYGVNTGTYSYIAPILSTRSPTSSDTKGTGGLFSAGQRWIDQSVNQTWTLASFTSSGGAISANWVLDSSGGSSDLDTLTGDTGTATPTNSNIQIAGGDGIATTASGSIVSVAMNSPYTGNFTFAGNLTAQTNSAQFVTIKCSNTNLTNSSGAAVYASVFPSGGVASVGTQLEGNNSIFLNTSASDSTASYLTTAGVYGTGNVVEKYWNVGIVNQPLQSSFSAALTTSTSAVVGNGGNFFLSSTSGGTLTELWDNQGEFNPATGTFTATAGGIYFFTGAFVIGVLNNTFTQANASFVTGGSSIQIAYITHSNPGAYFAADGYLKLAGSAMLKLQAGDTVRFNIFASGGAANSLIVLGAVSPTYESYFSGYLLG